MSKIQRFNIAVRLPEKDWDGNEVNRLTECDVVRMVKAKTPMMTIVEAEETDEEELLRERIHDVLRRYFEVDDYGNDNPTYDDGYTAQEAIDAIHTIVGDFFAKPK